RSGYSVRRPGAVAAEHRDRADPGHPEQPDERPASYVSRPRPQPDNAYGETLPGDDQGGAPVFGGPADLVFGAAHDHSLGREKPGASDPEEPPVHHRPEAPSGRRLDGVHFQCARARLLSRTENRFRDGVIRL